MKDMLNRGVIKIKKGGMPALHNDMRKAQVASYLFAQNMHPEGFLLTNSIAERDYLKGIERISFAPAQANASQIDLFAA